MKNTNNIPKFSLVLIAIILQIFFILGLYFSSFLNTEQALEVRLSVNSSLSQITGNTVTLDLNNFTTFQDYNSFNGQQNFQLGDTVYMLAYPEFGSSNLYNNGNVSLNKPAKQSGFGPNEIFLKGKIVEVIKPNNNTNEICLYDPNRGYYTESSNYSSQSSYSSSSYNSEPVDKFKNQELDKNSYNYSSQSSFNVNSSSDCNQPNNYSNYYSYKISYGIEKYQLDPAKISEFKDTFNIRAVLKVDKEGVVEFKHLERDNKKWPN